MVCSDRLFSHAQTLQPWLVGPGSDDCSWRMFHLPSGELVMSGEGHAGWLAAVAFHPQARSAGRMPPARTVQVPLAQSADGARPGAAMASLGTGPRPRPDGRGRPAPQATLLASAAGDAAVKLWSFALRRCVCTLRGAGLACRARPVSAAGSGSPPACSPARDMRTPRPGDAGKTAAWPMRAARTSPTSPLSSQQCELSQGFMATLGTAAARARAGHGAGVRGVAFHEAGDFLASASLDGCARVWHAAGGACRQALRRAQGPQAARQAACGLPCAQPAGRMRRREHLHTPVALPQQKRSQMAKQGSQCEPVSRSYTTCHTWGDMRRLGDGIRPHQAIPPVPIC
jgi:WD40 repeat protein